jgi:glucose/arabinose dehydrogenase
VRSISFAALVAAIVGSSALGQVLDTVLVNTAANGVVSPIFVCSPPGDLNRLFVVQKNGQIKVRTPVNQATVWTTFLNIGAGGSNLISTGSEQGLLGMAFHPQYATNGYFFVMYTSTPSPGNNVVARYQVSAGNPDVANPASAVIFLSIPDFASNHNAGCLQFGPDGYLYVGTGDGGSGNDPNANGQNINALLGKMLRIDVDTPNGLIPYSCPPTNPYFGATAGLDEIWAIGLRNPFRYAFDRLTGDLWIGDVGQDTQEEIDFQPATNATGAFGGRNYGWRCREGVVCTGLSGCGACSPTAYTEPVHTFSTQITPNCAVIGGYVYRGCAIPSMRGHYFFAEYGTSQIWSFTYNGTSVSNFTLRSPDLDPPGTPSITSIVSFGEDAAGELYICELSGNEIWKIVPAVPSTLGITSYGTGTPGCTGPNVLSLACSPNILNPGESINASNGPPGTNAIGIIGGAALPVGSDPLAIGVEVLVDLTPGTYTLYETPVAPNGIATLATPIPNAPALIGLTFYAQNFFVWSSCSPSPLNISSTQGLQVTIQP